MKKRKKLWEGFGISCYQVGEPYDKVMPEDGAVFEIWDGICILSIGLTGISKKELETIQNGQMLLSFNIIDEVIFICADFNNVLSFEAPFHAGLYKDFHLPKVTRAGGYMLPIILVDNATNIIAAIRVAALDQVFSELLYRSAYQQRGFSTEHYNEKLTSIFSLYGPGDILRDSIYFQIFGKQ